MQLQADSFILLSRKIEDTVMPLLRAQKGFHDGVTTVAPERSTAIEETRWNTKEDAEAYQQTGYLKVMEILSGFVVSSPSTSIFESGE
jgi:hypothetical protein